MVLGPDAAGRALGRLARDRAPQRACSAWRCRCPARTSSRARRGSRSARRPARRRRASCRSSWGSTGSARSSPTWTRKTVPVRDGGDPRRRCSPGRTARDSAMPIARGTVIGVFLGLIPGIGTILPTIVSYAVEKRVSRHPERFGAGAIEGVAGPEATNNAYANGALIPLFTLGVPASPDDRGAARRLHDERPHARALPLQGAARLRLGGHRQPLRRQRDPAHPQPAARRPLGAAAPRPLLDPLPARPGLHRGRRLRHPEQPVRRGRADRLRRSSATSARRSTSRSRRWPSR